MKLSRMFNLHSKQKIDELKFKRDRRLTRRGCLSLPMLRDREVFVKWAKFFLCSATSNSRWDFFQDYYVSTEHPFTLIYYESSISQRCIQKSWLFTSPNAGDAKKKFHLQLHFLCSVYMNLTSNRSPAFDRENMEQVGRFPASPEFCFENSLF